MALGHVETVFDPGSTGTIMIAPSARSATRYGVERAVLSGAQSPAFLERLRETTQTANVSVVIKTQGLLMRISVKSATCSV